jgi:hypothetical protein
MGKNRKIFCVGRMGKFEGKKSLTIIIAVFTLSHHLSVKT